ncbi:MAG: hypothetical protein JO268_16510 [Pseudonocardiales bacterium]|nr:hypothetical protein [Pseudonocardiales bacterium]
MKLVVRSLLDTKGLNSFYRGDKAWLEEASASGDLTMVPFRPLLPSKIDGAKAIERALFVHIRRHPTFACIAARAYRRYAH